MLCWMIYCANCVEYQRNRHASLVKSLGTTVTLNYSRTPLYPDAGYPDHFGSSGKFVENSKKLTYLEIDQPRGLVVRASGY